MIITNNENAFATATTMAELKPALFGAAMGDIALEYTRDVIQPAQEVAVFNDLVAVLQAINAGQIDCAVLGVVQGDYVVASEQVTDGVILGSIQGSEELTDGLGLLLEKDSPLTAVVTKALEELAEDGTIAALNEQYLKQYAYPAL